MVSVQPQDSHGRASMALRVRGGVHRPCRTAKQRAFNLNFSFPDVAKQHKTPCKPPRCTPPTPKQMAPPASPRQQKSNAAQAHSQPNSTSLGTSMSSAVLSISSVCIPACEGGRRYARQKTGKCHGSRRTTQLRTFVLQTFLPLPAPPLPPAPAASDLQPTDPTQPLFPSITPSDAPSLICPTPAPHTAPGSPLQSTGATPHTTNTRWMRATPLEGVPERMSWATAMRGPRPRTTPSTICTKPGQVTAYEWFTPIEGVLERQLDATCRQQLPLTPHALPLTPHALPTTTPRPSPKALSIRATPMEGVPERFNPAYSVTAAARMLAMRAGWGMGDSLDTNSNVHSPQPNTSSATTQPQAILLPGAAPNTNNRPSAVVHAQQDQSPASPWTTLGPAASGILDDAAPPSVTLAPAPKTGMSKGQDGVRLCEVEVQTSSGLANHWYNRTEEVTPPSDMPVPMAVGGTPLAPGNDSPEGHGNDYGCDDGDVGGAFSVGSTPAAMQPLDLLSAPASAVPSPAEGVVAVLEAADQANCATAERQSHGRQKQGMMLESPWPMSVLRSRTGQGMYGDDDAEEMADGGHMPIELNIADGALGSSIGTGVASDSLPVDAAGPAAGVSSGATEADASLGAMGKGLVRGSTGAVSYGGGSLGGVGTSRGSLGAVGSVGVSLGGVSVEGRAGSSSGSQGAPGKRPVDGAKSHESDEDKQQEDEDEQEHSSSSDEGEEEGQVQQQQGGQIQPAIQRRSKSKSTGSVTVDPLDIGNYRKTRRKSLAGAGLVVTEDGCRRSSRSRYRPLQYWRNEHKVFGRDHKTLPTVVAIETRTPNPVWPAHSTGHQAKKKMRARTRAGLADDAGAPHAAVHARDWEDDA